MKKLFLDANIFFAGARSPKGGSGFILELAKLRKIKIITTNYALLEAEKNVKNKLDNSYLLCHYQNLLEIGLKIQPVEFVSLEKIINFEKFVPAKDVPILLGALLSSCQFLITLDKKHFLANEKLKNTNFSFKIMNPGEFLTKHI